MIYHVITVANIALYAQPDAKVANGLFWCHFWLDLAISIIT